MIPTDGEPPGGSGFVESPCLHLQHAVARQHPGWCKHHLSESVRREGDLFLPTDSRYPNWEKLGETSLADGSFGGFRKLGDKQNHGFR